MLPGAERKFAAVPARQPPVGGGDTDSGPGLPRFTRSVKKREQETLQKWVQCSTCKKWRKVPYILKDTDISENWTCSDNAWDPNFASCSIPQALSNEEIDDVLAGQDEKEDMDDEREKEGCLDGYEAGPEVDEIDDHDAAPDETRPGFSPRPVRTTSRTRSRDLIVNPPAENKSATPKEATEGRSGGKGRGTPMAGAPSKAPKSMRKPSKAKMTKPPGDVADVAEVLVGMGTEQMEGRDGAGKGPAAYEEHAHQHTHHRFHPARLVWAKVEGHDWWPACVVRRRAVPIEVGPPPGGAQQAFSYIPVVFFTPSGIPGEVNLGMDTAEFPISACKRACGETEDDEEAEYAWLSPASLKPFRSGDLSGRGDGIESQDPVLRSSIAAAQRSLKDSEEAGMQWGSDNEDSDGGWGYSATLLHGSAGKQHSSRTKKNPKTRAKKAAKGKRPGGSADEEGGSDTESHAADGVPELLPYGSWELQPRIVVEHIYGWRYPLPPEERARRREVERWQNKTCLADIETMANALRRGEPPSREILEQCRHLRTDVVGMEEDEPVQVRPEPSPDGLQGADLCGEVLRQEEREAVSTLLHFSEDPMLQLDPGVALRGGYDEPEYFVKYAKRSHLHNEWVSESTLAQIAKRKLINFKRHYGTAPVNMFKSEWAQPERFLARRQCRTGPGWEVLVKWKDLGYEHCTWELEGSRILCNPEAVALYWELWERQRASVRRAHRHAAQEAAEARRKAERRLDQLQSQPQWVHHCQLHPHQLDALNWLRRRWVDQKGGLLIGEPGIGKTACLVTFFMALRHEFNSVAPILVVAPSGSMDQWNGEVAFWSGSSVLVTLFQGSPAARGMLMENEIWQGTDSMDGKMPLYLKKKIPKADIVLTTPEVLVSDFQELSEVPWELVAFDYRDGIKGALPKSANVLSQLSRIPRLALGSHVPDTVTEMAGLLSIVHPEAQGHPEHNDDDSDHEGSVALELRRQLEALAFPMGIPPQRAQALRCREIAVPAEFTPEHIEQYCSALAKFYETLTDRTIPRHSSQRVVPLRHVVHELSRVCSHPYLLEDAVLDGKSWSLDACQNASGKLALLGLLLRSFRSRKKKVLLMTQETRSLELLKKYTAKCFGEDALQTILPHDSAGAQFESIKGFNTPDSANFLFLLTPSVCGLGTHLPQVSVVIVFDSPPDPRQDIAALRRAYGIGSQPELPVLRLYMAKSAEEKIYQLAENRKKGLNSLLGSSPSRGTAGDARLLEDILLWGSQEIFARHVMHVRNKGLESSSKMAAEPLKAWSAGGQGASTIPGGYSQEDVDDLVSQVIDPGSASSSARSGTLARGLTHIKWHVHDGSNNPDPTRQDSIDEGRDGDSMFDGGGEGFAMAGYWENLLAAKWEELKKKELEELELQQRGSQHPLKDLSDNEYDSPGAPQSDDHAVVNEHRAPSGRLEHRGGSVRKRADGGDDADAHDGQGPPKKARGSLEREGDFVDHLLKIGVGNGRTRDKRSKEYLMHSKAQQDVLMRLISDPGTVEGQAALQAFGRIKQISDDLQLPPNVVGLACQIAEILLTMREESEQGAFFQDYTLVVLVAFAAHVSHCRLGDNYGLPLLAVKYGHSQASMDQVFVHITNALKDYRSTMVKVKELEEDQSHEDLAVVPTDESALGQSGRRLQKGCTAYMNRLDKIIEEDRRRDFPLGPEVLDELPCTPINGRAPVQWLPVSQAPSPELQGLMREARTCDVEMYMLESVYNAKVHDIEREFDEVMASIRLHARQAIEELNRITLAHRQEVELKQATIRQNLMSSPQMQPQQIMGMPQQHASAYYHLLQVALQATQQQGKPAHSGAGQIVLSSPLVTPAVPSSLPATTSQPQAARHAAHQAARPEDLVQSHLSVAPPSIAASKGQVQWSGPQAETVYGPQGARGGDVLGPMHRGPVSGRRSYANPKASTTTPGSNLWRPFMPSQAPAAAAPASGLQSNERGQLISPAGQPRQSHIVQAPAQPAPAGQAGRQQEHRNVVPYTLQPHSGVQLVQATRGSNMPSQFMVQQMQPHMQRMITDTTLSGLQKQLGSMGSVRQAQQVSYTSLPASQATPAAPQASRDPPAASSRPSQPMTSLGFTLSNLIPAFNVVSPSSVPHSSTAAPPRGPVMQLQTPVSVRPNQQLVQAPVQGSVDRMSVATWRIEPPARGPGLGSQAYQQNGSGAGKSPEASPQAPRQGASGAAAPVVAPKGTSSDVEEAKVPMTRIASGSLASNMSMPSTISTGDGPSMVRGPNALRSRSTNGAATITTGSALRQSMMKTTTVPPTPPVSGTMGVNSPLVMPAAPVGRPLSVVTTGSAVTDSGAGPSMSGSLPSPLQPSPSDMQQSGSSSFPRGLLGLGGISPPPAQGPQPSPASGMDSLPPSASSNCPVNVPEAGTSGRGGAEGASGQGTAQIAAEVPTLTLPPQASAERPTPVAQAAPSNQGEAPGPSGEAVAAKVGPAGRQPAGSAAGRAPGISYRSRLKEVMKGNTSALMPPAPPLGAQAASPTQPATQEVAQQPCAGPPPGSAPPVATGSSLAGQQETPEDVPPEQDSAKRQAEQEQSRPG